MAVNGNLIIEMRESLGLTRAEVAYKIGISIFSYKKFETGLAKRGFENLIKIADFSVFLLIICLDVALRQINMLSYSMDKLEKIISLCKSRGFIFPGSEIYGGLANTWDYGPLGVELKNNIKSEWWKYFVRENKNAVGLDGGILMNPNVWVASGHVAGFSDPLMDCKHCKTRHRADKLIDSFQKLKLTIKEHIDPDSLSPKQMEEYVATHKVPCPSCAKNDFTGIRQFNLMFKTNRGVVEGNESVVYLRPETAQSQFVNFQNLQRTSRLKIPFGVGQIGKAFRNEITPGNFIFRTVEFEQMEFQHFTRTEDSLNDYDVFKQKAFEFYNKRLGLKKENLRFKDHAVLCHYAKAAVDAEFKFPFGFSEIGGTHHRGTFDLGNHQELSKKSMEYIDPNTGEKFLPTVIESSHGCDRLVFAILCDAYDEEQIAIDDVRVVLRIKPALASYKVAVLPLQKKGLTEKAGDLFNLLSREFSTSYDDAGSIGKRYRRQDEIGTPFCLTIDYETLEDEMVTIRYRDTMEQERVKINEVVDFVKKRI